MSLGHVCACTRYCLAIKVFVRFVQTPATLFAWVDPSVGGKTAINNPHGKNTAVTGFFCRGGKIESRLLKFCQSHAIPPSGMAKCDSAKFKQSAITFCLIKVVRPRQWNSLARFGIEVRSTALLVNVLSLLTLRCTLLPPAKPREREYCSWESTRQDLRCRSTPPQTSLDTQKPRHEQLRYFICNRRLSFGETTHRNQRWTWRARTTSSISATPLDVH